MSDEEKQEEVLNESTPKNKLLIISLIILISAIIALIITGSYFYFNNDKDEENDVIDFSPNSDLLENNGEDEIDKNNSIDLNNESNNDSDEEIYDEVDELGDFVPNPYGGITLLDYKDSGEYSCNESGSDNPKHGLRIYTYRIIEGSKDFSEEFIEFDNTDKICQGYGNLEDGEVITYYLEWIWDAVEEVDGYRAFQYFTQENITRNYTHYVDTKFPKITDTQRNLWVRGNLPHSNTELNTTI